MLHAIIVDDEEIVRHGLRCHYHWYKYGIEVQSEFADGVQALEYLKANHVDLLVTDIVMPRMDGMELAKQARELYSDIKIIFISGYTDVKFLWGALKMNAVDYIFKSVDFDELDVAIERVVNMMQQRNSELEHMKWLEEQFQQNQNVLRQQQLVSMISSGAESEEELARACAALTLPLNSKAQYVAMVLRLSNRWNLLEGKNDRAGVMLDLEMQNVLRELFRHRGNDILFQKRLYEYVSIIHIDSDEYEELLLNLSVEIQTRLRHRFGAEMEIGISECFRGLLQVRAAYQNACDAIYNRYIIDDAMPLVTLKKYDSKENHQMLHERHRVEICNSIRDGQPDKIEEACKRAITDALTLPTTDEQQNFLLYLLMAPRTLLRDVQPARRGCYASHRRLLEQYLLAHDLHEQEECILRAYLDAATVLHSLHACQSNAMIKSVCAYVEAHYMDQLSIPSLAENVYLTPTYLCVLFKKHTGKTLNNYITQVRMDAARKILSQSNIHLQDVCYQVGYLSPSYFSRIFRKYFGQSPSEYRDALFMIEP